jgi:hypothetical protein
MNIRTANDKGGPNTIGSYRLPSSKATTFPRKKDKLSKREANLIRRQSHWESQGQDFKDATTKPGALK